MSVSSSFQPKVTTSRVDLVAGHGSPPNGLMSQTCVLVLSLSLLESLSSSPSSSSSRRTDLLFGAGRALRKAMCSPSGDQRGLVQLTWPRVKRTVFFSVRLDSMRWETNSPLSLSGERLTHTAHWPSGEICQPDALSAFI